MEHEKRLTLLRKQELKGADYMKIEKNRKEIEKLESRITVASQAIETTSSEIVRSREAELYPQLLELVRGSVLLYTMFLGFPLLNPLPFLLAMV